MSVNLGTIYADVLLKTDKLASSSNQARGFFRGIMDSINTTQGGVGGLLGSFQKVGESLNGLKMIGATFSGIAKQVGGLIGGNIQFEQFQTSFEVLLGSADAAKQRLEDLNKFAAETPFELPEIVQASKLLQTFGGDVLGVGDTLTMVGDMASTAQRSYADVAVWVARAYSNIQGGRPIGEAAMRLQEMGLMSGEVRTRLDDLADSGADANTMWEAFQESMAFTEGMMAKQAKTMGGLTSTFSDNISMLKRGLFEGLFNAVKPQLEKVIAILSDPALLVAVKNIGVKIGEYALKFFDVLWDVADRLPDVVGRIIDIFHSIDFEDFGNTIKDLRWVMTDLLIDVFGEKSATAMSVFSAALSNIIAILVVAADTVKNIAVDSFNLFTDALRQLGIISDEAGPVLGFLEKLASLDAAAIERLGRVVGYAIAFMIGMMIATKVLAFGSAIASVSAQILMFPVHMVKAINKSLMDFKAGVDAYINGVKRMNQARHDAVEKLSGAIKRLVNDLKTLKFIGQQVAVNVIQNVKNTGAELITKAQEFFTTVWQNIKTTGEKLKDYTITVTQEIVTKAKTTAQSGKESGKGIGEALGQGIAFAIGAALQKVGWRAMFARISPLMLAGWGTAIALFATGAVSMVLGAFDLVKGDLEGGLVQLLLPVIGAVILLCFGPPGWGVLLGLAIGGVVAMIYDRFQEQINNFITNDIPRLAEQFLEGFARQFTPENIGKRLADILVIGLLVAFPPLLLVKFREEIAGFIAQIPGIIGEILTTELPTPLGNLKVWEMIVGTIFLPGTVIYEFFKQNGPEIVGQVISGLASIVASIPGAIGSLVGGAGDLLGQLFKGIFKKENVEKAIFDITPSVTLALGNFFKNLPSLLVDKVPDLPGIIVNALKDLPKALGEIAKDAFKEITGWVTDAEKWLSDNFAPWDWIKQAAEGFAKEFMMWMDELEITDLVNDIISLGDTFRSVFEDTIGVVADEVMGAVETVITTTLSTIETAWDTSWGVVETIFVTTWDTIKTVFSEVADFILERFADILIGLADFVGAIEKVPVIGGKLADVMGTDEAESALRGMGDSLKSIITDEQTPMLDAAMEKLGMDGIGGLARGMRLAKESAYGAVREIVGGSVGLAKVMLDVRSPSRVFAEIGANTIIGFIQGMQSQTPDVVKAMIDTAKSAIDAFSGAIEMLSSASRLRTGDVTIDGGLLEHVAQTMVKAVHTLHGNLQTASALLTEDLKNWAGVADNVVGTFGSALDAFTSMAENAKTQMPTIARLEEVAGAIRNAINILSRAFDATSDKLSQETADWAGWAKETVGLISDGVAALGSLKDFTGEGFAGLDAFIQQFMIAAEAIAIRVPLASTKVNEAVATWAGMASNIVGIIGGGIDSLAALKDFSTDGLGNLMAFATSFTLAAEMIATQMPAAGSKVTQATAEWAGHADSIISTVAGTVDAFAALATYGGLNRDNLVAFAADMVYAIDEFLGAVQKKLQTMDDAAALWADGAGRFVGLIVGGVDAFKALKNYTPVIRSVVDDFIADIVYVADKFAREGTDESMTVFTDAAFKFVAGAGAVVGVITQAVDMFRGLQEIGDDIDVNIENFVGLLRNAIKIFAVEMSSLNQEMVDSAALIAGGALSIVQAIGGAVTAFADLEQPVSDAPDIVDKIIKLLIAAVKQFATGVQGVSAEAAPVVEAMGGVAGTIVGAFVDLVAGLKEARNLGTQWKTNFKEIVAAISDATKAWAQEMQGFKQKAANASLTMAATAKLLIESFSILNNVNELVSIDPFKRFMSDLIGAFKELAEEAKGVSKDDIKALSSVAKGIADLVDQFIEGGSVQRPGGTVSGNQDHGYGSQPPAPPPPVADPNTTHFFRGGYVKEFWSGAAAQTAFGAASEYFKRPIESFLDMTTQAMYNLIKEYQGVGIWPTQVRQFFGLKKGGGFQLSSDWLVGPNVMAHKGEQVLVTPRGGDLGRNVVFGPGSIVIQAWDGQDVDRAIPDIAYKIDRHLIRLGRQGLGGG